MTYLTIEDIRKQLRLEDDFTEDDAILEVYGDAAEAFLSDYLDTELDTIASANGGDLPKSLYLALLILVSYVYDNDGSGEQREVPKAFFVFSSLYKQYLVM